MKCNYCTNYLSELDTCKFCSFEFDEEAYFSPSYSDFDIMSMNEEDGWEHEQIMNRLRANGVDCFSADIWWDNNMAIILGVNPSKRREVAKALGINEDVIYTDGEHDYMILNLFQEKYLRGELDNILKDDSGKTKIQYCGNCKNLKHDGMFGIFCGVGGNNRNYDCPKYEEKDDVE